MSNLHPLVSAAMKNKTQELHCIKGFVGESKNGITSIFSDLRMNFCFEVDDTSIVEVINAKETQDPQLVFVSKDATVSIRATINPAAADILTNYKATKPVPQHPDCHGEHACNVCMTYAKDSFDRFICKLGVPGPMTGELQRILG